MEIKLAAGTYTLENAPFVFDANTLASEVRLIGEAGAVLEADSNTAPLFKVADGVVPKLLFRGLQLRSQVVVEDGELRVENCNWVDSAAAQGGALKVSGGVLTVADSLFKSCSAEQDGGAVHVSGGSLLVQSTRIEGCRCA